MSLRVIVVSEHAIHLGEKATKVFGERGGSIGRATDNDWILPDPERYLSGKHARIDFRAGSYVLVDTSSNGTFVNGAPAPLGKYHDYVLKNGDYVRLGEYELRFTIDASADALIEIENAVSAFAAGAPAGAPADELRADLDLSHLLEPGDEFHLDSGVPAHRAKDQAITPPRDGTGPDAQKPESGTPWHLMTRPYTAASAAAAAAAAPEAQIPSPALAHPQGVANSPVPVLYPYADAKANGKASSANDIDVGIAAFCRGAGIDPRGITADVRESMLQLAGQLLRESVLGLTDLNQSRHAFLKRFGIPSQPSESLDSPLNVSQGIDEAMVRLLTTLATRAGSVEAIRDGFRELKAQSGASLAATRAAFEEFLSRIDPQELEERFARATKRGVFGSQNKAKYWELYAELYNGLTQRAADGFPQLLMEAFAKAYQAKLRVLLPPRRSL